MGEGKGRCGVCENCGGIRGRVYGVSVEDVGSVLGCGGR